MREAGVVFVHRFVHRRGRDQGIEDLVDKWCSVRKGRPFIQLRNIVGVMLRVNAQSYLIEAGNVRHEHEFKVWRDVKLPAEKS